MAKLAPKETVAYIVAVIGIILAVYFGMTLNSLKAQHVDVSQQLSAMETENNDLKVNVTQLEAENSDLKAKISSLESDLQEMKSQEEQMSAETQESEDTSFDLDNVPMPPKYQPVEMEEMDIEETGSEE
ncbi:MAG: hypothetical protein JW946_05995 [Candidatus Omnitrophica bacterium]|nr:hypothetical protein [Candidatus Omnitrophota bacterium]